VIRVSSEELVATTIEFIFLVVVVFAVLDWLSRKWRSR
jgi:hypothetical protein